MPITAKKSLSQNFLIDKVMQNKVILEMSELVESNPHLPIVEIGPGQGDLTKHIISFGRDLIAVEIDPRAVEFLQTEFEKATKLKIIEADAFGLIQNPNKHFPKDFVLLSNLPYHLGSRIIMELGINFPNLDFAVILQKEVAGKTKQTSGFTFFGAWLNLFWDLKVAFDISPSSFSPQPNVYSSLLIGVSKCKIKTFSEKTNTYDINSEAIFNSNLEKKHNLPLCLETPEKRKLAMETLKKLFVNPRKSLFNNLKNLDWTSEKISQFYEKNKLDKNLRLTWESYEKVLELVLGGNQV